MIEIVTIENAKVKDNGIESDVEGFGGTEDDTNIFGITGVKSLPHDGETGVMIDAKGENYVVGTNNYNINITLDKGEIVIYSSDSSGNILSNARCNKDGEFVVNDGDRSAVAFDKLKEGFDQFVSDYNAELIEIQAGITSAGGVYTPTSTTANVDGSEVDEVKLP